MHLNGWNLVTPFNKTKFKADPIRYLQNEVKLSFIEYLTLLSLSLKKVFIKVLN